jgi:hypothetical protein
LVPWALKPWNQAAFSQGAQHGVLWGGVESVFCPGPLPYVGPACRGYQGQVLPVDMQLWERSGDALPFPSTGCIMVHLTGTAPNSGIQCGCCEAAIFWGLPSRVKVADPGKGRSPSLSLTFRFGLGPTNSLARTGWQQGRPVAGAPLEGR